MNLVNHPLHFVVGCFYYLSSAINPFLYSLLSKRFRQGFKDLKRNVSRVFLIFKCKVVESSNVPHRSTQRMLLTTIQKPGDTPSEKSPSRPRIPTSVSTPIFTKEIRRFKRRDLDLTIHIYYNELNSLIDDKTRDTTRSEDIESRNISKNRKFVAKEHMHRKSAAKRLENDNDVRKLSSERPNFVGIERQPIIQSHHALANLGNVGASLPVLNYTTKGPSSCQHLMTNNFYQTSVPRSSSLAHV